MKYEKVAILSTRMTTAATSHDSRRGAGACQAATRLARVNRVSGIVVTNPQNRRPLSGDRRDSGGELAHSGTTILARSEEHTSELQSQSNLVCRLLLEKKKKK